MSRGPSGPRRGDVLFQVDVNGRVRDVTVEREDGAFKVTLDGHTYLMNVARVDAVTLSLIVLGERGTSHRIGFADPSDTSEPMVYLDGVAVHACLAARRRRSAGADAIAGSSGAQRVTAPMPGKVVRVLVGPGDRVQPRQPVVVVEAMKMENELRAGRAGVVSGIAVEQGASVEAGAVLLVIDS